MTTANPAGPARRVETPDGAAAAQRFAAAGAARATVVLGHGAGRGPDTADLLALAADLPRAGVDVVLVTSPWVLAGRRVASPPGRLDVAWRAVLPSLRRWGWVRGRLVAGGRSAGARVAARTAADVGADALLLLAFPLHPPGRPAAGRVDELLGPAAAAVPVVVVQGNRDPFGTPRQLRDALAVAGSPGWVDVVTLPGADHGLVHRPSAPITAGEWRQALLAAAGRAVLAAGGE